ncbi:carbohydrate ABC transporter permease (plasmid) [Paenibacillus rhizovicinus]|uniref:Carbohydrate ABC transporter permease n=2 Tax=Paenibacillus rhizovicinus TaxID=2704463 RepID=A0A6C0PB72_9BACL|nr:carbohydrate ABC transporter permease [Paenibacillus rhizovicinus]
MISFSDNAAVAAGHVKLWPIGFNTDSYRFVFHKPEFLKAFGIGLQKLLLGVAISIVLTIMVAYPLSKEPEVFRWRTPLVWFFVITMLVSGGLIPSYIIVMKTGLINSIWALVLPGAVPVYLVVLLLNFFRSLPKELEESAFIEGASHWQSMWKIYVPLSLPAIATITLFSAVSNWNDWFSGLIYMNMPEKYPLATYLQTILITLDPSQMKDTAFDVGQFKNVSLRTYKAAQIFLGALPILLAYPFLQRFFVHGIVLGSVKE